LLTLTFAQKKLPGWLGAIPLATAPQTCNVLTKLPQEHYIGIDVGTGSARACIIDTTGDIKALAAHNIKLWQPETYGGTHYASSHAIAKLYWLGC